MTAIAHALAHAKRIGDRPTAATILRAWRAGTHIDVTALEFNAAPTPPPPPELTRAEKAKVRAKQRRAKLAQQTCEFDGCGSHKGTRLWCSSHAKQFSRHGRHGMTPLRGRSA